VTQLWLLDTRRPWKNKLNASKCNLCGPGWQCVQDPQPKGASLIHPCHIMHCFYVIPFGLVSRFVALGVPLDAPGLPLVGE
jgi:hypothetical protein